MIFPFRDNIPRQRTPVVTYAIIAINFAVACYQIALPPERRDQFGYEYGFMPARIAQLGNGLPFKVIIGDICTNFMSSGSSSKS